MSVGATALRIRLEQGLTQGVVGARAKLATSYVSRIENERVQPGVKTLARLATALGVPLVALVAPGNAAAPHRCPVSVSGECIGEQIRSHRGRVPRGRKTRYGKDELRLLKMTDYLVRHASHDVRRSLAVLLEALMERTADPRRRLPAP